MGQTKSVEIVFEDGRNSPIHATHGLRPIGIKNPGSADVTITLQIGFTGDEKMYDLRGQNGDIQHYFLRGNSFVALDPSSCSNIESVRLAAVARSDAGNAPPPPVCLVLAY
jgi:hypothetical protein